LVVVASPLSMQH